jgi:hypothetical protein
MELVRVATTEGLILVTGDLGEGMEEAVQNARHGVVILALPMRKFQKIKKHCLLLLQHLPNTRTDCDFAGRIVRARTDGLVVTDLLGQEVERLEYPVH